MSEEDAIIVLEKAGIDPSIGCRGIIIQLKRDLNEALDRINELKEENEKILRDRIPFAEAYAKLIQEERDKFRDALKKIAIRGITCNVCPKDCECDHCIANRTLGYYKE